MKYGYAGLAVLACLLFGACFKVRPVEPPGAGNSDWVSPTDYEILLENLKTALSKRNTQNYLRCFDEEHFRFSPAASLLTNNESLWQNWSLQDEQAYLDKLFGELTALSGNSLILEQIDLQDVSADSLRYLGSYTLRMNHPDTSLTTLFKGQVQWVIKINEFNEWTIHRWTDLEVARDSSWSHLKLRYIQ
ncbi:MAG: hypothetical protein D6730_20680 [Bacteroidetes bacterium]|nr:MAG: hypothetical protein D6730_20680 [Bacteroidota bacterium]